MNRDSPKITVTRTEDPTEKQKLESGQSFSDDESGRGTGFNEKSSTSASEASDSTSGIEMKYDTPGEESIISDSKHKSKHLTSDAPAIKISPKKSPRKSPVRKVQEGLNWVKRNLSPKKSGSSRERSVSPKVSSSPKKSPRKSPKKSLFSSKLKSPKKKHSAEEVEPFLLDDELRHSSSSSSDDIGTQTKKHGAIPKIHRPKNWSKDRDAENVAEGEVGRLFPKKLTSIKTKKEDHKGKEHAVPFSRQVTMEEEEKFRWSETRVSFCEEDYTASPSEIDLSSMSSYKFADFPDQIESETSSVAEKMAESLDMSVPEELIEESTGSDSSRVKLPDTAESESVERQAGLRRRTESANIENTGPKPLSPTNESPKSEKRDEREK